MFLCHHVVEVVEQVNLGEHLFRLYGDAEASLKQVLVIVLLHWIINSNQYSKTCQHESLDGVFKVTYRLLNRSWSTWWLIATLVTLKWNWVWYLKDPWKSYGFPWLPLISLPRGNVVVAWLVCFTSCFWTWLVKVGFSSRCIAWHLTFST